MQLTELRGYVSRWGWESATEYVDHGFSASKRDRPALASLLKAINQKHFDVVLVWKLDRIARSVQHLADYLQTFDRLGVRFMVPSQSIDTDQKSPTSRLLLNILSVIAEFERDLIRERTHAGLDEYRRSYKAGKVGKERHSKSGKDLPIGRPKRIFNRSQVGQLHRAGKSIREIAKLLDVGKGTVERLLSQKVA